MKKIGQHTILGWICRILILGLFCPFLFLALLAIAIYLPPIQKFAVDKAAEVLSEEMNMDAKVGSVSLKCPLDLCLRDAVAVQEGDTMLCAREIALSVRLRPLFDGLVEVDDVHIHDAKVNTRDLVEACVVKGMVGELMLSSHSTSLTDEHAIVNHALLKDADVSVVLADSTEEDTTESAPVNWKIDLKEVKVENVRAQVDLGAPMEHQKVTAYIGKGDLIGKIDLGKGKYTFSKVLLQNSEAGYNNYSLGISKAETSVILDTMKVQIPKFELETPESRLVASGEMDFSAFDSINPGQLNLNAEAYVGRGDIQNAIVGFLPEKDARELNATLNEYIPRKPIRAAIACNGNLEHLTVKTLDAYIAGWAQLHSSATMDLGKINANASLASFGGKILLDAFYDMNREAYDADISVRNFDVNRMVALPERCVATGVVCLKGQGFDFLSPSTKMETKMKFNTLRYGKIDVSSSDLAVKLKSGKLGLDYTCNNHQLQTDVTLDANLGNVIANALGKKQKESVVGNLAVNLHKIDAMDMGLVDTMLIASTRAVMDFSAANWSSSRPALLLNSQIDAITVLMEGGDSIETTDFDIRALTAKDTTSLKFVSGDLDIAFNAPANIMTLSNQSTHFMNVLMKHIKERTVDLHTLKAYMPILELKAQMGTINPVSPFLYKNGITLRNAYLNVATTPEDGLVGDGKIFSLKYDSVLIDEVFLDMVQDSSRIEYHSGMQCPEQETLPAFSAFLDGYLTMRQVDTHLQFFDDRKRKGIDLGLHGEITDTALNVNLYPEVPIIAFNDFNLNKDNYLQVPVVNRRIDFSAPILANVHLDSRDDSCRIDISGIKTELGGQNAKAVIERFNLARLKKVLPLLPNMGGMIDAAVNYTAEQDSTQINCELSMKDFAYDDIVIGNFHTLFDYTPQGTDVHAVKGTVDYNKLLIADLEGKYFAKDDGYLDAKLYLKDLPLNIASPFIPDKLANLTGQLKGEMSIKGPTDNLHYSGAVMNKGVHIISSPYSVDLTVVDDTIVVDENILTIDHMKVYGAGQNPLTINGNYDFADMDNISMALTVYGRNVKLIESKRKRGSILFGNVYGDIMFRMNGTMSDMQVRGLVNVLDNTDMTYIMTDATISQGDRLEDIVTFVDFSLPPDTTIERPKPMGLDMNLSLNIEDGAKFNCEFSTDRQSYVNVRGGGNMTMKYTPEGQLSLVGRVTVNEGKMKYTLPVIPLKTFDIASGSYVEFNGDPMNPTLNVAATEKTKARYQAEGSSARSVDFIVGLKLTNTLEQMGLTFTVEAPSDATVQSEIAGFSEADKSKIAVALLATGMYISDNNTSALDGTSALNNFLQGEINAITGKALSSIVDISMGIDKTTYANGQEGTDYSFQFSKRFFSDRLSVIIGGKVSDNKDVNQSSGINSFINDVSLEWRLDNSATRYVRLFHTRNFENLMEGEIDKNGAGIVLRKKVDKFTDLFIFKKKSTNLPTRNNAQGQQAVLNERKEEKKL